MESISLSQLCESVRATIRTAFDETYWVRAEVSSLSAKAGGHCYMELVESRPESRGRQTDLLAKVRANCWSNVWAMLSAYFVQETGMSLQPGLQVLLEVSVDFHPVYGMSLTVHNINPEFTLGDLQKKRRETIERLTEEGMMELQKGLIVPTLVRRIAVISAQDAAGYQDFTDQLLRDGWAFRTELFAATMQGERAARSIMDALDRVFAQQSEWDAVVIIRGGGATTDLGCFDDYELCSYCAQYPLPILSGIGHTRDVSVLDMVSYASVKTPTAAAEWLIERMQTEWERVENLAVRLRQTAQRQVSLRRERLVRLASVLGMQLSRLLTGEQQRLALMEKTIEMQSPEAIFRKGYSLVLKNGRPVRSAKDIEEGEMLTTSFVDGEAEVKVQKIRIK